MDLGKLLNGAQATRVGSLWGRGPHGSWMMREHLKLDGDHRVWRIIQLTKYNARLVFDSRSQLQVSCSSSSGIGQSGQFTAFAVSSEPSGTQHLPQEICT